jgi:hypothetical protein
MGADVGQTLGQQCAQLDPAHDMVPGLFKLVKPFQTGTSQWQIGYSRRSCRDQQQPFAHLGFPVIRNRLKEAAADTTQLLVDSSHQLRLLLDMARHLVHGM